MSYNLISLKESISNVNGFYCDGVNVGLRTDSSNGDVGFIRSDYPCDVSAVFTKNRFQAAPIVHFKKYPKNFQTNFLLVNAKNANAMTGERGIKDIEEIFSHLPKELDIKNPIMSSTGVIGVPLDKSKIISSFEKFDFDAKNATNLAKSIMTTDSFEKEICFRVELGTDEFFHIAAVCKGAGMINPAMATMLCFIATDANIPKEDMDELLIESVDKSFNTISVDGDTSTNDTVILLANRASKAYNKEAFKEALNIIAKELSLMILKDGEGANKVVAFEVKNAKSVEDAKKASKNLSNSLLVKTALFGEDPNWGRIASTIGASEIECDERHLQIYYDDLLIYSYDEPVLSKEKEEKATKIMKKSSFKITCDLGMGDKSFVSYGCDLSYDYVKINADYRT
ncbi:MAG: bifunctional ornithine acetyltransferase/N-acetylglutamate synthase [Sulfurospirillum sp.]|nr:MAG: bifunctional ornithine acetyltransferase/N-acetylglutamate synthase [Sulfurospirillum sp.]